EVNVRDDFLRLLYVEYEPTWEWRFIKEVFHRDPLVGERGFRTFLRSSDPRVRKEKGLFQPTLTPERSEFFANDVIFLGAVAGEPLTPRCGARAREFGGRWGGARGAGGGPRWGRGRRAPPPRGEMRRGGGAAAPRRQDRGENPFALRRTTAAG